jgi:type II secretory ATPase GspE/PulE/Tfp pilus assembly ATPase PilB-like protein
MDQTSSLFESAKVADMKRTQPVNTLQELASAEPSLGETAEQLLDQPLDEATLKQLQADQIGSSEEELPQFTPSSALVRANIISEAQALSLKASGQHQPHYDLVKDVVDKRIATEELVVDALTRETGYQKVLLRREQDIQTAAWHDYEVKLLEELRILPYKKQGNMLYVAVADERGLLAVPDFSTMDHSTVVPLITPLNQLEDGFSEIRERMVSLMKGENASAFAGDVIGFVELLLHASVSDGVSDIHIEPYAKSAVIRRRIDGVMQLWPVSEFLFENYVAVIARVKILAALNISERRLPQDGAITIQHDGDDIDIRVSMLPALFGERVVMRILNKGSLDMSIDTIGFGEHELEQLKRAVDAPQGLVLVTGPTGSGKSTTLYSVLNRINQPELNILTAEDPVEYQMEGVGQVQVKEEIGLDFSAVLRSFLRQDPDVILVGEIRDKETVDIAIKAALTGHLVLSTLHTNDAASTISRLVNIGVPPYLIASSLKLVVAQRLARKICMECREENSAVTPADLIKIGFSESEAEGAVTYHGKGCPNCHGTGYKGRQGIYEVLSIGDHMREVIEQEKTTDELQEAAIGEGFRTMQEIARTLIVKGDLSLVEYSRVMLID